MDAVIFTSYVCNTFIDRFFLKGLPYGYGNSFWRSFWTSRWIRGRKTWAESFSLLMVSLTLYFIIWFFIFYWILNLWLQLLHISRFGFVFPSENSVVLHLSWVLFVLNHQLLFGTQPQNCSFFGRLLGNLLWNMFFLHWIGVFSSSIKKSFVSLYFQ